jgi:hypothetical protein
VHAVMGVTPQQVSVYEEIFASLGLSCVRRADFGTPFTYLYVLRRE